MLEAIQRHATEVFRYPQGGNPRLVEALATKHAVAQDKVVLGNGSDEIIDLLIRILVDPSCDEILCCDPCFNLYPIQAQIAGVKVTRCPLQADFSFNFAKLKSLINEHTRLIFLTTPDNPSGYCPKRSLVLDFAQYVAKYPSCLLLIDEAYMDFCQHEADTSLLYVLQDLDNVGILRTFSKSYGLAGLRLGYAILPQEVADAFWRARLPFSVNILAEEAALAALKDVAFREETLMTVAKGRAYLAQELQSLGCTVYPSQANYLLFKLPSNSSTQDCYMALLAQGIIIRRLTSYNLPEHLRVSIGNGAENELFVAGLKAYITRGQA